MERGRGTHRADIDGLRGLAVGAVIVYHYWPALLPGGFLGVTMFFVLSGYLMGQILESGLDKGSFSFRTFYARRAVRITPALVGVLVTTVVAVLVMCVPPAQVADTASSGAAAALGLGNVQLWHQGGSYFADSEGKRVFLHLWSLGVEEQFYALLPLLLFGCPHGGARMAVVAVSLAVASVAAGWATASAPKAAYYLLPFRVPELLGGVLAAMAQARGALVVMLVRQRRGAVAWGSLAALGAMMGWGFDAATPFPSLWAALPVACTVALLLSGAAADGGDVPLALQLMAEPVMVWMGALSYSLYLYHWPLLALARILSPSALSAPQLWLLVGLTVALASVSFYAIEGPLRVPERAAAVLLVRVGVALLLLAMVATSASWTPALALPPAEPALGLRRSLSAGWSTKRTLFANDSQLNPALFADLRGLPPFVMGADNLVTVLDSGLNPPPFALPKSLLGFGRVRPTRVLLWGDSHAAHSYGILQELMGERKFFAAVHSGCNPVGPVNSRPIDATQWITPSCLEFNPFVMREVRSRFFFFSFFFSQRTRASWCRSTM